jgi:hypothetical protein
MAFFFAAFVFVITLVLALFALFAFGMSDNPADNTNPAPFWIFGVGTLLAIMIATSHYGPHLGW